MTIYVQPPLNDMNNAKATANKLLAINPNNIRALYLVAIRRQNQRGRGYDKDPASAQPILDEGAADAQKGLAAPKPACTDDAGSNTLKRRLDTTFYDPSLSTIRTRRTTPAPSRN